MSDLARSWPPLAIMFALLLLLAVFAWYSIRRERKLAKIWDIAAEGDYDRVEYRHYTYTTRSGAMVHTTHYHRATVTTVHFTDGRSCACRGRFDPDCPRGTRLRISRNRLGDYRIEKA